MTQKVSLAKVDFLATEGSDVGCFVITREGYLSVALECVLTFSRTAKCVFAQITVEACSDMTHHINFASGFFCVSWHFFPVSLFASIEVQSCPKFGLL